MELVSIIIPIYNAEKYLKKCIQSILEQTYSNIEVILVNDGSTDKSRDICDEYARQESRIHVIHQDNSGVSAARKNGLKKSMGNYIAFIDSDDWVEDTFVEKMYNVALEKNADMVACGYFEEYMDYVKIEGNRNGNIKVYSKTEALEELHTRNSIYPFLCNKIFKRKTLNELEDSVPVIIGEDYTIVVKAISRMQKIAVIEAPLYHYMQRKGSACNRGFDERLFKVVSNYKDVYNFFKTENMQILDDIKSYILLEEMYYVVCMSRNQNYNKKFIRMVTFDVRKNLLKYIKNKKVKLPLKCCALACALNYHFLIAGYKIVNHNRLYYD